LTRSELIEKLAKMNPGLSLDESEACVGIVLDEILSALSRGERVELRGFGIFTTRHREARVGRNPKTGETVNIESKSVPFFKAGKELKEKLNKA
jgi:integration host factor subunit beta